MLKTQVQKLKVMYLLKILLENSDEKHVMSMNDIIEHLATFEIMSERKSIYDDIDCLRTMGYDIICQKGRYIGYYIGKRDFELAELKLLVDSVQSSKFITIKKSGELIDKISNLTSKHYAKEMQRQVYITDRVKTINETIYYNVDTLHNAIAEGVKIAFKYYEYNLQKKRQIRNNGDEYVVSPYNLAYSDDNYYLIAHSPRHEGLSHFRVDRMDSIRFLDEKAAGIKKITNADFNLGDYLKKTFDMYHGETKSVSLLCNKDIINPIIDKFGQDVLIRKEDEESFIVTVNVNVSPTFYAWVFTFSDKIKIISPNEVVSEFIDRAKITLCNYTSSKNS
jgi:predicted DNA-binding transcriptional regulator YafY